MKYLNPNLFLSLALLALLTTFSNCEIVGLRDPFESCPEDINLGEISFLSDEVWSLRGQEDFIFANQNGDEIIFRGSTGNQMEHSHLIMETTCTSAFSLSEQYSYYEPEHLSFSYHQGNGYHYLWFLYQINNDIPYPKSSSDTILFESLYVEFYDTARRIDPGWNKHFGALTSDRGNPISQKTMAAANDEVRIIADTTLYGLHYENLICPRVKPGVFYSKEYGIVLLRYNSDWWYLKR